MKKTNENLIFDTNEILSMHHNTGFELFEKDEIMAMAEDADNAQDGVIIAFLFDGLSHRNGFEELINLKRKDIDFEEGIIRLKDREISISHETKVLVQGALEQNRPYISIKGETSCTYKIAEGDNVLRGFGEEVLVNEKIISNRIQNLEEKFGYENLNAETIYYSGINSSSIKK